MRDIFVRLLNRDWTLNRYQLEVTLTPIRFSINALGGYDTAEIEITGPIEAMFAITDMLRCGIELYDGAGQIVWQGYIWQVELPWGQRTIGRSLELAANTVQVAYNTVEGEAARTDWATNTRHIARYGIKELVADLTDSSEGQAEVFRDTLLAMRSVWPAPKIVSRREVKSSGKIICRGLYSTLDWRHYSQPEAGLERLNYYDYDFTYGDQYDGVANASLSFGDTLSREKLYFWFVNSGPQRPNTLTDVQFSLAKVGSPADNVIVDLVLDNSGVPGTVLETFAIDGSAFGTTSAWQNFTMTTMILPGLRYGFVLRRSGSISGVNYYLAASSTAVGGTNGQTRTYVLGTWTTASSGIFFKLNGNRENLIDVGAAAARTSCAMKFTVDDATANYGIVAARVPVAKVGTPADNFRVQIYTDSSGSPGTLVGTVTVAAALISTTQAELTFSFGLGQVAAVAPGTALWLVVSRTGALDPVNYYVVAGNNFVPSFTFVLKHYNGSTWATPAGYVWMPYAVTYGAESTEQIRRIATATGQFFTAIDIRNASGVFVPAFASGDFTGLTLIHELLQGGNSSGVRLNAQVTNDRRLQIFSERALDSSAWYEAEDGTVRTRYGTEVADDMTVGMWLVPQNLPGGELPTDWAHFIESTDWNEGKITRTSRDARDALDVFGVQDR